MLGPVIGCLFAVAPLTPDCSRCCSLCYGHEDCCPVPYCREGDGDNQRFCGIWTYSMLVYEHENDGIEGTTYRFADLLSGIYLSLRGSTPYVDFWANGDAMEFGIPPVLTWPPWPDAEPWNGGLAWNPNFMEGMRIRADLVCDGPETLGKMEDFVYQRIVVPGPEKMSAGKTGSVTVTCGPRDSTGFIAATKREFIFDYTVGETGWAFDEQELAAAMPALDALCVP